MTDTSIAVTILKQLGGNKFITITGAKNLLSHGSALSFKLPSTPHYVKDGINYVKISLNVMDTYDIEFGKIRGHSYKIITTTENVYCDDLQRIFTETTGLNTRLF
jgi:hypothetical protein